MARRLTIPTAIVVAVVGVTAPIALSACGDENEEPPEECTIEGMCPDDGRVCLDERDASPCCPICPVDGVTCPSGCILEFPPI